MVGKYVTRTGFPVLLDIRDSYVESASSGINQITGCEPLPEGVPSAKASFSGKNVRYSNNMTENQIYNSCADGAKAVPASELPPPVVIRSDR